MTDYVRQERKARSTGTTVQLLDAEHPGSEFDPGDGGRWVTLCVDHGGYVQHDALANARDWSTVPEQWCPYCRGDEITTEDGPVKLVDYMTSPSA